MKLVFCLFCLPLTSRIAIRSLSRISQHPRWLLQFDGGSRGNPGIAGSGAVLMERDGDGWREVWGVSKFIGVNATNNQAEYHGIIAGLQECHQRQILESLLIQGDSNLVIKQLKGEYKVRSPNIASLYQTAVHLLGKIENVTLEHIPRAVNHRADELANKAMDEQSDSSSVLSSNDELVP